MLGTVSKVQHRQQKEINDHFLTDPPPPPPLKGNQQFVENLSNQHRRACPKSTNGPLDLPDPLCEEFPFAGDVELLRRSHSPSGI